MATEATRDGTGLSVSLDAGENSDPINVGTKASRAYVDLDLSGTAPTGIEVAFVENPGASDWFVAKAIDGSTDVYTTSDASFVVDLAGAKFCRFFTGIGTAVAGTIAFGS